MLAEMKDNPSRFKGKKVLYIHTGTDNDDDDDVGYRGDDDDDV